MKRNTLSIAVALVLSALGASLAWATPPNFQLTLAGNGTSTGNGYVLDGIYISPYTAVVNGVSTLVICDDFTHDVALGETWQVTTSTVASLASNVMWKNDPNEQTDYNEAAWLVNQLLAPNLSPTQMGEISYAIWAVFDPTDVQSWLKAYGDTSTCNAIWGSGDCTNISGSGGLLSQAAKNSGGDFSNVLVYTPVAYSQSCCGTPQEFLAVQTVRAPEASALATLGFDFTCLAVVLYFFRRRLSAKLN